MSAIEAAALAYARRGWPVLLLEPGRKRPLSDRKACPHGVDDATTDEGRIRSWAWRFPTANLGIACGPPGPTVQDVDDPDHDQARSLLARVAANTPAVATRRGRHLYFAGDHPNRACAWGELRGRGLYVAAPPSVVDDRAYVWTVEPDGALPPLPAFLAPEPGGGAGGGRQADVERVAPGAMYAHLVDLATRCARAGMAEAVIARVLTVEFDAVRVPDANYGDPAAGRRDTRRIAAWAAGSRIAERERAVVHDSSWFARRIRAGGA